MGGDDEVKETQPGGKKRRGSSCLDQRLSLAPALHKDTLNPQNTNNGAFQGILLLLEKFSLDCLSKISSVEEKETGF